MSVFDCHSKIFRCGVRLWRACQIKRFVYFTNKTSSFTYLNKIELQTFKMSNINTTTFKFTDYDCIGLDLDGTLARYKIGAMIEMEYDVIARYLVERKGYSKAHLYQPFDRNFILRGLIIDDENGNILRIAPDGHILQVSHGTKMLDHDEIESYYPNRYWEPVKLFAQDPLSTWNGPYSEKMRTILDYFDIAVSLVFARAVDSIDERNGRRPTQYNIWADLLESMIDMFAKENFQLGLGGYYTELKANPDKYYHKCSAELLDWLKNLRQLNKKLFLLTGSHVDFASHTASNTIGPDWRDYFDIVVCFAKKPGFFNGDRHFVRLNGVEEAGPLTVDQLQIGGIYNNGNWKGLRQFFTKHLKSDPKFLYVGDNLVQDIYTPHAYKCCDTVTVCEELEAEGVHGHQQWHPDEQFLVSTVWGSYFKCNNVHTNWYHLMQKHSKLCVPSLEYVATLPIDHAFTNSEF